MLQTLLVGGGVQQYIYRILSSEWEKYDKLQKLLEEIMSYGPTKTIIFTDTKRCADDITRWVLCSDSI